MNYPVRQFKMISGHEIVCEVVENPGEDKNELVVRRVLEIEGVQLEDFTRSYIMRPWMLYQDGLEQLITINPNQVIAVCRPTESMIHQFYTTLGQCVQMYHIRETHGGIGTEEIDLAIALMEDTDDAMGQAEDIEDSAYLDSNQGNVISFPGSSDKIH